MNTNSVIEIFDSTIGYFNEPVLKNIFLDIQAEQIHAILGTSGCGKSTLMKAMVGLLPPLQGNIQVCGRNMYDHEDKLSLLSNIGVLFQGGALLNGLNVLDNVCLPIQEQTNLPKTIQIEMAMMKLQWLHLEHAAYKMPTELSGGMKKRAALARAMVLDPAILFCDEPSAGLDPVTSAGLDDLLLRIHDTFQTTILLITHELTSIRTIATHATFLAQQHVIASGTLSDVEKNQHPAIDSFFRRHAPADTLKSRSTCDLLLST